VSLQSSVPLPHVRVASHTNSYFAKPFTLERVTGMEPHEIADVGRARRGPQRLTYLSHQHLDPRHQAPLVRQRGKRDFDIEEETLL